MNCMHMLLLLLLLLVSIAHQHAYQLSTPDTAGSLLHMAVVAPAVAAAAAAVAAASVKCCNCCAPECQTPHCDCYIDCCFVMSEAMAVPSTWQVQVYLRAVRANDKLCSAQQPKGCWHSGFRII